MTPGASVVRCATCGAVHAVAPQSAGATLRCGGCGQLFVVPVPAGVRPASPAPQPLPPHLRQGAGGRPPAVPPTAASAAAEPEAIPADQAVPGGRGRGRWLSLALLGLIVLTALAAAGLAVGIQKLRQQALARAEQGAETESDDFPLVDPDSAVDLQFADESIPAHRRRWADASQVGVKRNGVQVNVVGFTYAPVFGRDAAQRMVAPDRGRHLQVKLKVANQSGGKLPFHSWYANEFTYGGQPAPVKLVDDQDREFRVKVFAGVTSVQGQTVETELEPGQAASDVIVFEIPAEADLDQVHHWKLELPAAAYGGEGYYRFFLPRTMLQR